MPDLIKCGFCGIDHVTPCDTPSKAQDCVIYKARATLVANLKGTDQPVTDTPGAPLPQEAVAAVMPPPPVAAPTHPATIPTVSAIAAQAVAAAVVEPVETTPFPPAMTAPPAVEAAPERPVAVPADAVEDVSDPVTLPDHYARFKIEPVRFIIENDLSFFQGNVVKYVVRHDAKNGVEDLKKAMRYLSMYVKYLGGDEDWWEADPALTSYMNSLTAAA